MELKKGTSLIELVIIIGLISLLALAMSAIMLTTITSSNRIRRLTQIKQAGDYTLNQIQTLIRNSLNIESCDPDNNTLSTLNPDGNISNIFLEDYNDTTRVASNSGIYMTPSNLVVTNFTINCDPIDQPVLFKIGFDIAQLDTSGKPHENATIHFETTTNIRND